MQSTWLPIETVQRRRQLQRVLLNRPEKPERYHFSEFLTNRNVLFFEGRESKIEVVETLVGTLSGKDHPSALQAIWARERQGALIIVPDVAILRCRLEGTHHMRAALGLCADGITNPANPQAKTRVLVVLVGPVGQTHLHMNLLTSISALFRTPGLTDQLLRSGSADEALRLLQKTDGVSGETNVVRRTFQSVRDFFVHHYGVGEDLERD